MTSSSPFPSENPTPVLLDSSPSPPPLYCIVCLKKQFSKGDDDEYDGERSPPPSSSSSFSPTTQKSLQNNNSNKVFAIIESFLGAQKKTKFSSSSSSSRSSGFSFQFCPDCELLLNRAAELVGRLRRIELEVEWKVGKIKDIMVAADRVPSRINYVKGIHYHTTTTTTEVELESSESSGRRWDIVQEWRQEFVRKCTRRQLASFPRVSLRKIDDDDGIRRKSQVLQPPIPVPLWENESGGGGGASSMAQLTSTSSISSTTTEEPVLEPDSSRHHQSFARRAHLNSTTSSAEEPSSFHPLPEPDEPLSALKEELLVDEPEIRVEGHRQPEQADLLTSSPPSSSFIIEQDDASVAEDEDGDGDTGMEVEECRFRRLRAQFRCQKCSKTFSSKVSLDSHQQERHDDDDDGDNSDGNEEEDQEDVKFSSGSEYDESDDDSNDDFLESDLLQTSSTCSESEEDDENCQEEEPLEEESRHNDETPPVEESEVEMEVDVKPSVPSHSHHHQQQVDKFTCPLCKASFTRNKTLRAHYKSHHHYDPSSDGVVASPTPTTGKVYKCKKAPHCPAYFILPKQLHRHQKRFHQRKEKVKKGTAPAPPPVPVPNYQCKICRTMLGSLIGLRGHYAAHHDVSSMEDPTSQVQRCEYPSCAAYFRTKVQLECHKAKMHFAISDQQQPGQQVFHQVQDEASSSTPPPRKNRKSSCWCSICKIEFSSVQRYKQHYGLCHDLANVDPAATVQRCNQTGCSAYFRTLFQLRTHLTGVHGLSLNKQKKYVCSGCSKPFNQMWHLRQHFAIYHDVVSRLKKSPEEEVHRCDQPNCTAYFLQPGQLERHRGQVHGTCKWYECQECGEEFRGRGKLHQHRRQVHNVKMMEVVEDGVDFKFGCEVDSCSKKFATREKLQRHKKYWHNKNGKKDGGRERRRLFSCPKKCDKVVRGRIALRAHLKEEHPDDDDGGHNKREKRGKRGKRPSSWMCETCGKAFKRKDVLAVHYKTHAGPDSWEFQCSTCGKKCVSRSKLGTHMRSHTGEKPYCCQHCGLSYTSKHRLRGHVKSKHPEEEEEVPPPSPSPPEDLSSRIDKKSKKTNNLMARRKGIKRKTGGGGGGGGEGGTK